MRDAWFPLAPRPFRRYRFSVAVDREERPQDEAGGPPAGDQEPETTETPERAESKSESGLSAPSIGPKTVIDRPPPEERLAEHDQSQVDAMGLEKRREVVGGSYSPSFAKQMALYGGFVAVAIVVVIGFLTIVDQLDQPAETHSNDASWAQPGAPQVEPAPLDSPRNGSPNAGL